MNRLQNKTKIVATLGPASTDLNTLESMFKAGVNVCRLNFSHGKHDDLVETIKLIRSLNHKYNAHVSILADLQGPKIRIGKVSEPDVVLKKGSSLKIITSTADSNAELISINYENFLNDVQAGEKILIDDGKLVLEIKEVQADHAIAEVLFGGPLSSNKGVNLPNTKLSLPCLTEKDMKDLEFALEHNLPWIGLSFVRSASDIDELKALIKKSGRNSKVVAKIEKPEAVSDLHGIIESSDALMVARGDLGVEVPMEEVPLIQKNIVKLCRKKCKPVIIATQMMESMVSNINPTRAEVNDVANAVMDGADAVMLSGETSVGDHPTEVIKAMYKIIVHTEQFKGLYYKDGKRPSSEERRVSNALCRSACELAETISVKGIVTMTFSGYTTQRVASYRPDALIFVFTGNEELLSRISLIWGVRGFYYDKFVSTDHTIEDIKSILKDLEFVDEGDHLIHLASMPIADRGTTNMMKLSSVK